MDGWRVGEEVPKSDYKQIRFVLEDVKAEKQPLMVHTRPVANSQRGNHRKLLWWNPKWEVLHKAVAKSHRKWRRRNTVVELQFYRN